MGEHALSPLLQGKTAEVLSMARKRDGGEGSIMRRGMYYAPASNSSHCAGSTARTPSAAG